MPYVSRRLIAVSAASLSFLFGAGASASAQEAGKKAHRLLLHIDSEDTFTMNHVLGNATNAKKYYDGVGEVLQVEIVAYGPGITMFRDDKSPVKDRIAEIKKLIPDIALSMCNNAKMMAEKREGHEITPLVGVKVVPAGIVRIIELEEQGWSYVKP